MFALLAIVSSLFILALLHRNIVSNDVAAVRTSCTPSAPERENAHNPNKTAYNQCVAVCFSWHLHMIHIFMIFTYVCSFYNTEQWMQAENANILSFGFGVCICCWTVSLRTVLEIIHFQNICAAVLSQTFNGILTVKNPFVLFYFLFLYFPCHIITLGRSISIFITLPYKMKTVNKFSKWIKMINSVKENDLTDCNSLFLNLSLQFFKLIHRNHLLGPLYMAISNQWHPKPIPFNAK